jgi:hypothetical protein
MLAVLLIQDEHRSCPRVRWLPRSRPRVRCLTILIILYLHPDRISCVYRHIASCRNLGRRIQRVKQA